MKKWITELELEDSKWEFTKEPSGVYEWWIPIGRETVFNKHTNRIGVRFAPDTEAQPIVFLYINQIPIRLPAVNDQVKLFMLTGFLKDADIMAVDVFQVERE